MQPTDKPNAPSPTPETTHPLPSSVFQPISAITIRQRPQYLENLTNCEQSNIYRVYKTIKTPDPTNNDCKGKLLSCKEKSTFCHRNCTSNHCRPFDMLADIYTCSNGQLIKKPFLSMHREYGCTCFCCHAPVLTIEYVEDHAHEILGRVVCTYTLCSVIIRIREKEYANSKYVIIGNSCQPGFYFKMPCKGCREVSFVIRAAETSEVVGHIKKKWDCSKNGSYEESMGVEIAVQLDWRDKCLIISAAMICDFIYFEEGMKNKNGGGIGISNHIIN